MRRAGVATALCVLSVVVAGFGHAGVAQAREAPLLRGICDPGLIEAWSTRGPAVVREFATSLDADVVRLNLRWSESEQRRGVYDEDYLGRAQAAVQTIRAHGMQAVILVYRPPRWASDRRFWGTAGERRPRRGLPALLPAEPRQPRRLPGVRPAPGAEARGPGAHLLMLGRAQPLDVPLPAAHRLRSGVRRASLHPDAGCLRPGRPRRRPGCPGRRRRDQPHRGQHAAPHEPATLRAPDEGCRRRRVLRRLRPPPVPGGREQEHPPGRQTPRSGPNRVAGQPGIAAQGVPGQDVLPLGVRLLHRLQHALRGVRERGTPSLVPHGFLQDRRALPAGAAAHVVPAQGLREE